MLFTVVLYRHFLLDFSQCLSLFLCSVSLSVHAVDGLILHCIHVLTLAFSLVFADLDLVHF